MGVFVVGFMVLLLDFWGRVADKKKSPEDYLYDGYVRYSHQWGSEGLLDNEIKFQKRLLDGGLDWILEHCLIHSPNFRKPKFSQIKGVAAAWAGYVKDVRGLDNYRWIVELKTGRYMYIRGFFDPSGFELRTGLWIRIADTPEKAARFEIRMKTLLRMNKDQEVCNALLDQIKSGERDWAGFKWGTDYAA